MTDVEREESETGKFSRWVFIKNWVSDYLKTTDLHIDANKYLSTNVRNLPAAFPALDTEAAIDEVKTELIKKVDTTDLHIDGGKNAGVFYEHDTKWILQAGKYGVETRIYALAILNGEIYGGTYPNGNLLKWNGTNAWTQVAPKYVNETYVVSLTVLNGEIYGGTLPNGNLLKWNGTNAWTQAAPKYAPETSISCLTVLNGEIYGGTAPYGRLLKWNGTNAWTQVAGHYGSEAEIYSLTVLNGEIYGGSGPNSNLLKWNGTNAWTQVAPKYESELRIDSLTVLNGEIYGGTGPNGILLKWNGTNAWTQAAPKYGAETYICSLTVLNGEIYGGTLTNGILLKWNGTNAWTQVAPKYGAEIRIYCLTVLNGEIYGGTRPNGNLFRVKNHHDEGLSWVHNELCKKVDTTDLHIDANKYLSTNVKNLPAAFPALDTEAAIDEVKTELIKKVNLSNLQEELELVKADIQLIHDWDDGTDHAKVVPPLMNTKKLEVNNDAETKTIPAPGSGYALEVLGYQITICQNSTLTIQIPGKLRFETSGQQVFTGGRLATGLGTEIYALSGLRVRGDDNEALTLTNFYWVDGTSDIIAIVFYRTVAV